MNYNKPNHTELAGAIMVVPRAFLDSLMENQNKILELLNGNGKTGDIGDYITEGEAQKLLGRKATWFWYMRSKGLLAFSKVGNKVFYARKEIQRLIDSNKQEAINA